MCDFSLEAPNKQCFVQLHYYLEFVNYLIECSPRVEHFGNPFTEMISAKKDLRLCSEEVSSTKPEPLVLYNLLWFNGDK